MTGAKQKILKKLQNTYCRLKSSKIEGIGIFAIRDIPKEKDPFFGIKNPRWQKFSIKDLKGLDMEVIKMIDNFFVIEEDNTVYLPETGLAGMDISFFLNNSRTPNLKIVGDGKEDAIYFRTKRKIKKGEELTVSYTTFSKKVRKTADSRHYDFS